MINHMTPEQQARWDALKSRINETKAKRVEAEAAAGAAEQTLADTLKQARAGLVAAPVAGGAWDEAKVYIADDEVMDGGTSYVAVKFSRGKRPSEYPSHWAGKTASAIPLWDDLQGVVTVGTKAMYDGQVWTCIDQHIKSVVSKPKAGSTKWAQQA